MIGPRIQSKECRNFVDNTRKLCFESGKSFAEISKECGFHKHYLTQFLNYRGTCVELDTAVAISRYFGIPIEFLIEKDLGSGKRLVIVTDE